VHLPLSHPSPHLPRRHPKSRPVALHIMIRAVITALLSVSRVMNLALPGPCPGIDSGCSRYEIV
jgi:hypothetical protein